MTAMPKLSRRRFSHLALALLGAAALPRSALAFGGPSGAKTLYPVQGHLGELIMNPYRIAPLTAIIRSGGYEVRRARVRIVPKEGGQEIAYGVSRAQLLTHGGIPVFGLYPDWVNKVEVSYDRIHAGRTEHFEETYSMYAPPVIFKLSGAVETKASAPKITVKKRSAKFADRLYYINNIAPNDNNSRHAVWNNPSGGALQWTDYPLNFIIDTCGEIRWYLYAEPIMDVDSLYHGGIMMGLRQNADGAISWGYGQRYVKYDIMGREIWNRRLPFGYNDFSHAMDAAQNGHWFLRVASSNHKLADGRSVRTVRDVVIEVDQNGTVVDEWKLWEILDPNRSDMLKALDQGAVCLNIDPSKAGRTLSKEELEKIERSDSFGDILGTGPGRNWAHVNSIDYDPTDDSIILSLRHQCAVVKIGRDRSVKWILGAPKGWKEPLRSKLLTPVDAEGRPLRCGPEQCEGSDFDWTWTQHTAWRADAKSDRRFLYLTAFDNGDARGFEQPALPDMKYSRAVIYRIDQEKHTVQQIWEYGRERGHDWFSPVTSLCEYNADKDSVLVYSATAGVDYSIKAGGASKIASPWLDEFEWGAKEPSVEIRIIESEGYQAFAFDVKKAFAGKTL